MNRIILILSLFVLSFSAQSSELDAWADQQYSKSIQNLLKNISPEGTTKGAVIASPSRKDPDYWFHWVRDGALVMDVVLKLYQTYPQEEAKAYFLNQLTDFVTFTKINQDAYSPVDLGEPKYFVDGRAYDGPWGRPQNDGPALRARTLTKFAVVLLNEGKIDYVRSILYNNDPRKSVIKRDLEYVAHNWHKASFDLWEEVKGQNFYTLMAQYTSLKEGADLAEALDDQGAADFYREQARMIGLRIGEHFVNTNSGYQIFENLHRVEGLNYKYSGLDTASVLAYLHNLGSYVPSFQGSYLLATILKLEQSFDHIYTINKVKKSGNKALGISLGRYPEDQYYGGNPWFLTSLAVAEHHYGLSIELASKSHLEMDLANVDFYNDLLGRDSKSRLIAGLRIPSNDPVFAKIRTALIAKGERIFERVRYHAGRNGALDEQFDRNNGYMLSARDLTWSYASFITAYRMRNLARR